MWDVKCAFFSFSFSFPFFFHWESFLLRWLHWDKQQRNLIKWMPEVMTLSKHAAALSINQRMLKENSDLAAYEYWWALNTVVDGSRAVCGCVSGPRTKGERRGGRFQGQWQPVMLFEFVLWDFHVVIGHHQQWSLEIPLECTWECSFLLAITAAWIPRMENIYSSASQAMMTGETSALGRILGPLSLV